MKVRAAGHQVLDKTAEGLVQTLNGDGSVTLHALRTHAQVLELEGEDHEIAEWLTAQRNQHLDLCRATGWYLRYTYGEIADRPQAVLVVVWWEDATEWTAGLAQQGLDLSAEADPQWAGPMFDLGITYLRWRRYLQNYQLALEAQIMARMTTVVAQDIDDQVLDT